MNSFNTNVSIITMEDFFDSYDNEFPQVATIKEFPQVRSLLQKYANAGVPIENLMKWLAYKHKPFNITGKPAPYDSIVEVIKTFKLCNNLNLEYGETIHDKYRDALLKYIHYSFGGLTLQKSIKKN